MAGDMRYAVFADLSRPLTLVERSAISDALDATVPDGGCAGRQQGTNDEVYFCVDGTEEEAMAQAACYMTAILQAAGLSIDYSIQLQKDGQAD